MRVIIVGAGIIGCAIAVALARRGMRVTVVEGASGPGSGATAASFGWINASFYLNADHFRLRARGLQAWRDLAKTVDLPGLSWTGALWWEGQGAELEGMQSQLSDLNYPVELVEKEALMRLEPGLKSAPLMALRFGAEGCADPRSTCFALARAAELAGARFVYGARVTGIGPGWVDSRVGRFEADQVVLAAGTGASELMAMAGANLPMLHRPGVLLKTAPLPPLLSHILVTPEGEIRQDATGALVMPTAVGHQADDQDVVPERIDLTADAALARLAQVVTLPAGTDWAQVSVAARPVPQDGLPVMGFVREGLYLAVMHSGITLAALAAQIAAEELSGQIANDLSAYRPNRFSH